MLPESNYITRSIAIVLIALATIHLSQFIAVHSEFDPLNGLSFYLEIRDSRQPLVVLRENVSVHSISSEIFTSSQLGFFVNTALNESPATGQ